MIVFCSIRNCYIKTTFTPSNKAPLLRLRAAALVFAILLFTSSLNSIAAQQSTYRISNIAAENGLIIYGPRGIAQDSLGNIWIGGNNNSRLLKYDGNLFKAYDPYNRKYHISQVPPKVCQTKDPEILLMLHAYKAFTFNSRTGAERALEFPPLKNGLRYYILNGLVASNGEIWCLARVKKTGSSVKLTEMRDSTVILLKSIDNKKFESINQFKLTDYELNLRPKLSQWNNDLALNLERKILKLNLEGEVLEEYSLKDRKIKNHAISEGGDLWLISSRGQEDDNSNNEIYFWDIEAEQFIPFSGVKSENKKNINGVQVDDDHLLIWGERFIAVNRSDGSITDLTTQFIEVLGLNKNSSKLRFNRPFKDKTGVYWVPSTLGLFTLEKPFRTYQFLNNHSGENKSFNAIRGMTEGKDGLIYFLVDRKGIFGMLPEKDSIWRLPEAYQIKKNILTSITYYAGYLFVDNVKINLATEEKEILGSKIYSTTHTIKPDGQLIITGFHTKQPLLIYDPLKDTITAMDIVKSVVDIIPLKDNNGYWLINQEVQLLDENFNLVKKFQFDLNNEQGLLSERLYGGLEDQDGNLWLGSDHGLSKLVVDEERFIHYTIEDGLPSRRIFSMILESDKGIWLGTGNGLSWFDFSSQSFYNLSEEHGINNKELNRTSTLRTANGKIYFGGFNGIDAFYADDLLNPGFEDTLNIQIIDYSYYDNDQEKIVIKNTDVQNLKKIELEAGDKMFRLKFQLSDYRSNVHTMYSYKLEGYDKNWSKPSTDNFLQYENTPPGKYELKIKASLSPNVWNPSIHSIMLHKAEYWYKTNWAYIAYFLLLLGLLFSARNYELARIKTKNEKEKLTELHDLKSKLFTNITHEFRTPLTVIQGMADQLDGNIEAKSLIRRNSKRLLLLVNQLLDMSKLESDKMELQLIKRNIISYLRYLTESFQSYAQSKKISITFNSEVQELVMYFDPEKMQHILANLISNAIKFTHEGGAVFVLIENSPHTDLAGGQPFLKITIKDNGIGIREEHLPFIFDRFYQVDQSYNNQRGGTGIGLSLTKELIELNGGTITVKSNWTQGTTFAILLPVVTYVEGEEKQKYEQGYEIEPAIISDHTVPLKEPQLEEQPILNNNDYPQLLIIEDNVDVIKYISTFLKEQYFIEVAQDGEEGIKMAVKSIPDIIICDLMMPKKDGYEVTEFLKNDQRTSHIPIIMLTAKADDSSKLEGIRHGADAYLYKPFSQEELLLRMAKLIELRQKLQLRYQRPFTLPSNKSDALDKEDVFLKKIQGYLFANLDNASIGVAELCLELGVSQSQLYRKVKALTGKSSVAYIRSVRLYKAYELLQASTMNISEVAYSVGFSDPNYFSKAFYNEFDLLPSHIPK